MLTAFSTKNVLNVAFVLLRFRAFFACGLVNLAFTRSHDGFAYNPGANKEIL